jgi:hypothetical protein
MLKRFSLALPFVFSILFMLLSIVPGSAAEECLVIGEKNNPLLASRHFSKALDHWRKGQTDAALDLYEEAVMNDRTILSRDDEGMATALVEKYRDRITQGETGTELLCRLGFFENVVLGNLDAAIAGYKAAAAAATTEKARSLATNEAVRLWEQRRYLQEWQQQKAVAARRLTDRQIEAAVADTEEAERFSRFAQKEEELKTLEERLIYLRQQEKEEQHRMSTFLQRTARFRRYHYYDGSGETDAPVDETSGTYYNIPRHDPSLDNRTRESDLANLYVSRRKAKEASDQVNQIRAEISGLQKRIKTLSVEITRMLAEEGPPPKER